METARRPSTAWFWVAAVIALAGLVGAVAWGWHTYGVLEARLDSLPRSQVPGEVVVDLAQPQGLTVYYEDPTAAGGFVVQWSRLMDADGPVDLQVTGPSGDAVPVADYVGDLRFDTGGRVAIAVATFDAPTAGSYTVAATGDVPATARVSVGQVVDGELIALASGAVVVLVASLMVAGLIVVVVGVKRARTRGSARPQDRQPVDA